MQLLLGRHIVVRGYPCRLDYRRLNYATVSDLEASFPHVCEACILSPDPRNSMPRITVYDHEADRKSLFAKTMARKSPPTRIHILPLCIPTPRTSNELTRRCISQSVLCGYRLMIARGTPRYRLPTIPPPIPLIVSASHTIIRLQTKSSWVSGSRNVIQDVTGTARPRPPPWVSSRPIAKAAQDMRKGVDKVIRAPKAVRLVPR
jgi:hypothetical protein